MDRWGRSRLLFGEEPGRTWGGLGSAAPLHFALILLWSQCGGRGGALGVSTLQGIPIPTPSLLLSSPAASGEQRPSDPSSPGRCGEGGGGRKLAACTSSGGAPSDNSAWLSMGWGEGVCVGGGGCQFLAGSCFRDLSSVFGLVHMVLHPRGFSEKLQDLHIQVRILIKWSNLRDILKMCLWPGASESQICIGL